MLLLIPYANVVSAYDQSEADHKKVVEQLKIELNNTPNSPNLEEIIKEDTRGLQTSIDQMNVTPQALDTWVYRYQLSRWAEALIDAGLPMSGSFLFQSLADSPSDLTYQAGDDYSNRVKSSSVMKNFIKNFRSELPSSGNYYSKSGSLTLNSPKDLYLSLNKVSYLAGAEKVGSTWTVYVRVYDTYDFERANYTTANGVPSAFVTWVNNYAVDAQDAGAIVPYNIVIYIKD